MKYLSYLILLSVLLVGGIAFSGCKDDDDDATPIAPGPNTVTISKIELVNFPATKSNSDAWDNDITGTPPPDVYIVAKEGSNVYIDTKANRFENLAKSQLPLSWTVNVTLTASSTYTFTLLDYDSLDTNDEMGAFSVRVSDYSGTKPSTIRLVSGSTDVILHVSWQ